MSKFVGYLIMAIGLLIVASPFVIKNSLPSFIKPYYLMIFGFVVMGLGLIFMQPSSSTKISQSAEEVPIYEGEGKKRRIVGYRKEK